MSHGTDTTEPIHGLLAEFDNPTISSSGEPRASAGYTSMDAYTPFPIEELDAALG